MKMSLPHFILILILVFCLIFHASKAQTQGRITKTIIVDLKGQLGSSFTSIQKAIDSVSTNGNGDWTLIHVRPGIYNEVVTVNKEFILLEGESNGNTVIQWGQGNATFTVLSDNFIAQLITFKNTKLSPAAVVYSDKASFGQCGFVGVENTIVDVSGRHFFFFCYIEGAFDVIWGRGQSVYWSCAINAIGGTLKDKSGVITAQARQYPDEANGFVFIGCNIKGTGSVYLGRAYERYSRVVFQRTYMSNIIKPEGWLASNFTGHENDITYTEVSCSGPGANKSGRVKWEKTLSTPELNKLIKVNSFINYDNWIYNQPLIHIPPLKNDEYIQF